MCWVWASRSRTCGRLHEKDLPALRSVQPEFAKASVHPLAANSGVHTPDEAAIAATRHVECEDCYNSHWEKARVSLPGRTLSPRVASGPLAQVRGVNIAGTEVNPAAYEYEVCLRCHADSPGKPAAPTPRQFPQQNLRLELVPHRPSADPFG